MGLDYFSWAFSLLFIFKYFLCSAGLQLLVAQFWALLRNRKKIPNNHPESDSLFYDFAFLSTSVPLKVSCTRDHSSGQQEICRSPQELPSFLFIFFLSFQGVQRKKASEMSRLKLFLNIFLLNFLPVFIWLGNTGVFTLIGVRTPTTYKVYWH